MAAKPDETYWVGFDLGATKMLATVFDSEFQMLGRNRKKTKGQEGTDAVFRRMVQVIQTMLDEAHIARDRLGGIGIGCPGPLDLDQGIILDTPNLGWKDVPIKAMLEKEFGCPAVILNDVDAGIYGEYRFGAGRSGRCVIGVFPGTGIGGGCVYEGKILRGKTGSCMEIGHVPLFPDGSLCGCGQRGCLEAHASRLAIAGAAAQAVCRGEAPHLQAKAGADLAEIRSATLAEAIKEGDQAIEEIVRQAARSIGVVLAGVVNLLAPDTVILGGGLVEAMPELFVDGVGRAARKRVLPAFAKSFKVVPAQLGDDAAAMGAAAWARESVVK
ncbi:MAG: ROK family protein [Phycisphaerae bacterium]|nr:ROK family protein [Phycisphaerae bacterium]